MNYQSCIYRIFSLPKYREISNGLDNMFTLSSFFQNPSSSYKIIHIAGTNGKGSVSLKCARALESAGYKTGLYISPHIFDFRERISVNSQLISESFITSKVPEIFNMIEAHNISVNFFEVITMLAFMYFKAECVDYAVIEVGLGGSLDATNIVRPEISIITQIGLDHCEVLGDTIEKIAEEKAGIIKSGVDCVIGADCPAELFRKICEERNSNLLINTKESSDESYELENSRLAELALNILSRKDSKITQQAILQGVQHKQPFRQQTVTIHNSSGECNVIIDVGHNPSGLQRLMQDLTFKHSNLQIKVMLSMSVGKSIKESCEVLAKYASSIHCVSEENGRLVNYQELVREMSRVDPQKIGTSGNIREVLPMILDSLGRNELLVICGSFYMIQNVRCIFLERGIDLV